MTRNQKIITLSAITITLILLFGCGNQNQNVVSAVDSLKSDTTLVDTLKVDSIGKK